MERTRRRRRRSSKKLCNLSKWGGLQPWIFGELFWVSVAELGNCWLSDELFGRRGNASLFCSSSYLLVRYAGAVRVGGRPITRAKRPRLGFFYFEGTVCGGLNSGRSEAFRRFLISQLGSWSRMLCGKKIVFSQPAVSALSQWLGTVIDFNVLIAGGLCE